MIHKTTHNADCREAHPMCLPEIKEDPAKAVPVNIWLHHELCDYLKGLYERKNADYGDSFHDTFVEEGMAMARIRLGDKLKRFKTLTTNGNSQVTDESIRDTLLDLANYAIMTVVEIDREGIKNDDY